MQVGKSSPVIKDNSALPLRFPFLFFLPSLAAKMQQLSAAERISEIIRKHPLADYEMWQNKVLTADAIMLRRKGREG